MAILGGIRRSCVGHFAFFLCPCPGVEISKSRGWETSSILRDYLANYVNRRLDRLSAEELENATAVQEAIKSAFVELDDEIISDGLAALYEPIPHAEAMCRMAPANSGSCALMALYDPDRSILHVAGTGDSRAVLGRRLDNSEGNTWTATVLSVEHTGLNAEEKARIEAKHPGEDMFSTNGRFLSSEVTRSFGDNRRKWPAKALEDLEQDFSVVFTTEIFQHRRMPQLCQM